MSWLRAIVGGIFDALFGWMQKQREKPPTAQDANTPKAVRDELGGSVDDWMKEKDNQK